MILAVTGHRPDKLGGYGDDVHRRLVALARDCLRARLPDPLACWAVAAPQLVVCTGMALGWDQAVARAAGELDIPYVAVVPHRDQPSRWNRESRIYYDALLGNAARTIVLFGGAWQNWMLLARNAYLVGACDELLALWSGAAGGTAGCVAMAERAGKPVTNCWEGWSRG